MTADETKTVQDALKKNGWVFAWRDKDGKVRCAQPEDLNPTAVAPEAARVTSQKCKNYTMPDGSIITICR